MSDSDRISKRRRGNEPTSPIHALVDTPEVFLQHKVESTFRLPGLVVKNHFFRVPLDHSGEVEGEIDLFVRELVGPNAAKRGSPYLLYLQGGPGFESPRPAEPGGWIKSALLQFRVILLDQRGTGRSSQINVNNLKKIGPPEQQAAYLQYFRADSIVKDCEIVRKSFVAKDNHGGKWSVMGQSFGGFCCTTYLSFAPDGLLEVLMTGGIPPSITEPCSADAVYRALSQRVLLQNQRYYARFPEDVKLVQDIVRYLDRQPEAGVRLSSGTLLTSRAFQLLGMQGLGSGGGFERLHYLLEYFFDDTHEISPTFMKQFESWMPWDTNPLYALLHESIYCQGQASNWSAHRIRETEFKDAFDASFAALKGKPVMFTGEMVFPWMFNDFACLRPYKAAAHIIAAKADWPQLYNPEGLKENTVPVAAATYLEDMYVDYNLAQSTADYIRGLRQWVTNEYRHSGIRDDGHRILDRLLNMARGCILD